MIPVTLTSQPHSPIASEALVSVSALESDKKNRLGSSVKIQNPDHSSGQSPINEATDVDQSRLGSGLSITKLSEMNIAGVQGVIKPDEKAADRIRNAKKPADLSDSDQRLVRTIGEEYARVFPGSSSMSMGSATRFKNLDFPLEILEEPLNPAQLNYLQFLASHGFGINLSRGSVPPDRIPCDLLVTLLRNACVKPAQQVRISTLDWLWSHPAPAIIHYMQEFYPDTLKNRPLNVLKCLARTAPECLEKAAIDRYRHVFFLFGQCTRLLGSILQDIHRVLEAFELLGKNTPEHLNTLFRNMPDTHIILLGVVAHCLGFETVARLSGQNESVLLKSPSLLEQLMKSVGQSGKEYNIEALRAFLTRNIENYAGDKNHLFLSWYGGLPKEKKRTHCLRLRDSEYLNTTVSFGLLHLLAEQINTVELEPESDPPTRIEVSVLAHLFLRGKLTSSGEHKHPFLSAVEPLAQGHNLQTPEGYSAFMNRLVSWNALESAGEKFAKLSDSCRMQRPELCMEIEAPSPAKKYKGKGIICGTYASDDFYPDALRELFYSTEFLKHHLIGGFLEQAPREHVEALLNQWFSETPTEDSLRARNWLFAQKPHPNSALFEEHIHCNTLLHGALSLLPASPQSTLPSSGTVEPASDSTPAMHLLDRQPDGRINRTLFWKSDEQTDYLKLQSASESDYDFQCQYARLKHLYENTPHLGLKSTCAKPKGLYILDPEQVPVTGEERTSLTKTTGFDRRLAMHLSMPAHQPYEAYVNNPELTPAQALDGSLRFAHDYGRLWCLGINGPDALSAYHDKTTNRQYHFLAEMAHIINLGLIDCWRTTTDFPNIGPWGMRDHGDSRPSQEFRPDLMNSGNQRDSIKANPDDPVDVNRVRLCELARAAWGMVLLWGDRYNCALEKAQTEEEKATARKDNDFEPAVIKMLSTLFSEAFSIPQEKCKQLIREDGLYDQAVREMRYWMDNVDAPYVKDMLAGEINREVYPTLSSTLQAPSFADPINHLTKHGFVTKPNSQTPEEWEPDTKLTHLGAIPNGVNPLMTLNDIVVKLITYGCLRAVQGDG